MEIANFKSYIKKLGFKENTWLRPTSLNYIILESDANQFFNPALQKIYFDTTNGMIKIKYSRLITISSLLNMFSYDETNKIIIFHNGPQSVYSLKKIREPRAGDYIGLYTGEENVENNYVFSLIESIKNTPNGTQLKLYDDKIIQKIKLANKPMSFFIVLQGYDHFVQLDNPVEFYAQQNTNDSFADIYIDIDRIVGFNFDMNWRPNNL